MFNEKKEKAKLKKIFDKLPENKKLIAEGLICNASFMIVELERLQCEIAEAGEVEQYQHGQGQSGNIMSAAAKSYVQIQKSYLATINSLSKMLPKDEDSDERADELMRFIYGDGK